MRRRESALMLLLGVAAAQAVPLRASGPPRDREARGYSRSVEAMKAAGITRGCQQSPLYCPDRPITRAEMAVYLSIALGLHWAE